VYVDLFYLQCVIILLLYSLYNLFFCIIFFILAYVALVVGPLPCLCSALLFSILCVQPVWVLVESSLMLRPTVSRSNCQFHAPAALPPEKEPPVSDRRLGGPQSRSGRHGEEKILDPTGTRNSDPSIVQPVASRSTDNPGSKLERMCKGSVLA
jgi:hypothetical protein